MKKALLPELSILLVTYNHALYIDDAIRSIFRQDYDGAIELIVADDASSDDTLNIIKSYENQDERFSFRYLPNEKNLGITKNYQRAFAACAGKYVAILEGDDIWIHRSKLTKQVALLHECAELVLCGSNYFIWNEATGRYHTRTSSEPAGFRYFDTPFIINDNFPGNFSACVYRVDVLKKLPKELFDLKAYDWAVNIFAGMYGVFAYIHEPLSAYRIHDKGMWSGLKLIDKLNEQIQAAEEYNSLTNNLYTKEFDVLIRQLKHRRSIEAKANKLGLSEVARKIKRLVRAVTPPILISFTRWILPPAILALIVRW